MGFLLAWRKHLHRCFIGVNYAFLLLALKDNDFADTEEARLVLTELTNMSPSDHLGQTLKAYGEEALTRIEDREEVRDYVGLFLDGKMPK